MAQLIANSRAVPLGAKAGPTAFPIPKNHYSRRPSFPSGLEVLLVESTTATSCTVKCLESCGYNVTQCRTCTEAESAAEAKPFDILLVETEAVTKSARNASQLLAWASGMPIVMISESCCVEDIWTSISTGFVDIICRPVCKSKLQTLWQHTVRHHSTAAVAKPESRLLSSSDSSSVSIKSSKSSPSKSTVYESKKRKAKDISGPIVTARPPLAIKPSGPLVVQPHVALSGPMPMQGQQPAFQLIQQKRLQPMVGFWAPQAVLPAAGPTVIQGSGPLSWGHPVVGLPGGANSMSIYPGQASRWTGGPIPISVPTHVQMVHASATTGATPMVLSQPAALPLPAQVVPAPVTDAKVKTPNNSKIKATDLPSPSSQSTGSLSSASDDVALHDMIAAEDLIRTPQCESVYEASSALEDDFMATCNPTALDDISEEEYAFVDFALSDAFPSVHEDDILPALGLSLQKSNSFLNIQMVC